MSAFANQIVWITGAGSGLGRALAHAFHKQGAHIVLSGRREERLQEVHSELANSTVLCCDVTQSDSLQHAIHSIIEKASIFMHQMDIDQIN